jgi:putative CocE/NonD family hydrolase
MPSYADMLDILSKAAAGFHGEEERIEVPALVNTGWYDIGAGFELYRSLREKTGTELARKETKTIVGPWGHNGHEWNIGEWGFGQFASLHGAGIPQAHLDFYSRHLRGDDSVPELANVRYFVMGANAWKEADDWPIPGTEVRRLYLHSRGAANTSAGDGVLSADAPAVSENPDRYRYDPADPVPSFGLRVMYNGGSTVHGPFDQHRVEARDDVLVYTSAPFEVATEVAGDVELVLAVSSSAPETDFFTKLCVVSPTGVSCNLADAALRTRYLHGWDDVAVLERDHVYELRIRLGPTAYLFPPGSRVRVQVTSSCFPHWDRNMNTGNPPGEDRAGVVADQVVHHSAAHVSYLDLPVTTHADSRAAVLPGATG